MEARIPPTVRWPLRLTKPAAVAALTKAASLSASPVTKVTFMRERSHGRTGLWKSALSSR